MRIFTKQLLLYLGTLMVSLALLGAVLVRGIHTYFTDQRVDALTDSAQRIARSVDAVFIEGAIDIQDLERIYMLHLYLGAKVMLVNSAFESAIAVGLPMEFANELAAEELMPLSSGHNIVLHTAANHLSDDAMLAVGYPVFIGNEFRGGVLLFISMAELDAAIAGMYQVVLVGLAAAAGFAFILIYLTSRAISRPLRQINEAARVIAGGNLSNRLPVKSRDEVGQLATQFNRMAESLQQQEQIRRDFVANLSHDIRSPLTSMKGFLQAICDGTIPPDKHLYYVGIVQDETERLIKLSNDLLDIERVQDQAIEINLTAFDINDMIRKTVLGFAQHATEKRLTFTSRFAHATDMVWADSDKIVRCLYNLIDNAVKFTPQGGAITIETTVIGAKVSVSIADNGRGMTPEEQKQCFNRFYKGDPSRNEDKMGSGLGLSIVRAFILAHGEQITVASEPAQGSIFTFTLKEAIT